MKWRPAERHADDGDVDVDVDLDDDDDDAALEFLLPKLVNHFFVFFASRAKERERERVRGETSPIVLNEHSTALY